jgi:Tol biopolymer transport system component
VLLAALLLALAAPGHAEIAFVSDGRIWSARADGSERRVLVRGAEPAWSPDGSRLAYVRDDRLWVDERPVTPRRKGVQDSTPAWSPDGGSLVFGRFVTKGYRTSIVVRELATGAERVLVETSLLPRFDTVSRPDWSPNGTTIAYTHSRIDSQHDLRPDIRTVPAAGGPSTLLVRDAQSPAWSPDGGRLAFASVRDRNGKICSSDECWFAGEIYTAVADGSNLRRLTDNEGDDAGPRWSPDGSRILFTSDRNLPSRGGIWHESEEVYSMAPDGSCLTWLTNGTPASSQPAWRPASGGRFDPGSCDPGARRARIDHPPLPRVQGGLWLGPRYRGLLLSGVERAKRTHFLWYDDCARFDGCGDTLEITSWRGCPQTTPRRRFRMRGALVLYHGRDLAAYVLSGRTMTGIWFEGSNRLHDVRRVVRHLRPYRATSARGRLPAPRSC